MSEQTSEALNFGPQWIRDLSNGANVSVPPPSPSYKLAQFRYGKEEMLALFSKNLPPPNISKDIGDFVLKNEACSPLAMTPLSDEEQRNSFGSLNSTAVLKMMGRGGQRGGRGAMPRAGRGSGRGRGEQGFYRGFSQDDSSSNKTEDGWQRDTLSRKHSWGESTGRGGFGERTSGRDTEVSPRGYDPTASSGRHSRALASGNWRVSEGDDDGGGWVTSRGSERSDRWRTSSRDSWHRDDHPRERRFSDRNSFDDVPEWSKLDSVFEPDSGSFDSTGAFCVAKDKKPPDDSGGGGGGDDGTKEDWDLEINEDDQNDQPECDVKTKDTDTSHILTDPPGNEEDKEEQENAIGSAADDTSQPVMEEKAAGIEPSHEVDPRKEHVIQAVLQQQDEVGANLERVAESCIANLDVEGEEPSEEKLSSSLERQGVQRSMETKWFYRDPQGQEQGPFSNEEMVEWFHHGYFTMQLSVRRHCDAVYFTLGDLIKRWKRVPFMPGPSPPPITHQQVINEQTMFMQQQLLQQHLQHLQKQAILQQIQQQQQLQHEQRQQAAESSLQLNFPPENQPSPTVVSPRSLPTTTHSGSPIGAAEMIWGTEPESPQGSWSSQGNTPSWKEPQRQTSPVPIEDIQRREREREIEEEKERERLEMEKAERLKQEEEKRKLALKQQEEERLKRLEEERRQEEIIQKAEAEKRKQEEAKKKANAAKEEQAASQYRARGGIGRGKLYEMMEKEGRLGRKQRQEQDEEKSKEESRNNGENEQRKKYQKSEGEKRKQEDTGKRSKTVEQNMKEQASKHQEDAQARLEEEWEEEMKEKSTKKRENDQQRKLKVNGSSRWVTSQSNATMSLSEIQEQEEKNRLAHEEKMKELQAKQRQLHSSASHGWSSEKLQAPNNVKSLKTIQDEQARQAPKQSRQSPRSQPSQVSSAWNMTVTAGNNNVWTGNHNDREEEQETGYCDDVTRVHNTGKNQSQAQKNNVTKQAKQSNVPKPVSAGKKSGKKSTKEEESVHKIFQQAASKDPFSDWCTQNLHGLATDVDIPTFVAFLKEMEPSQVHMYVREYLGDGNDAQAFAKEFIERRRNSEWRHVPTKTSSPPKQSTASTVVARGGGGVPRGDSDSSGGKTKKKKKQRMQKVDPSILGFSVNAAAERVNMGEIQSVDDS